jgi:hypothetical protein
VSGGPSPSGRFGVRHARVAAVGEQQAVREGGRRREKRVFGVAVRSDLLRENLARKPAACGEDLRGRR